MRGKDKPADRDVCIIIPDDAEKDSIELSDSFRKAAGAKVHATVITERDFERFQPGHEQFDAVRILSG